MGITDNNTTYEDWREHPLCVDHDAENDERAMQKRMEANGARRIGAALYIENP
jgi:hypothetical protein